MAELQEERVAVEARRVQAEQAAVLEAKLQAELAAEKAEAERLEAELQAELEAEEEAARGIERIGARERLPNLVGIESGLRLWSPFTQDPGVFSEECAYGVGVERRPLFTSGLANACLRASRSVASRKARLAGFFGVMKSVARLEWPMLSSAANTRSSS